MQPSVLMSLVGQPSRVRAQFIVMMTCRDPMPILVKTTQDNGKDETKMLAGGIRLSHL